MTTAHEQAETTGHDDCQGKCICYQRGYETGVEDQAASLDHLQDKLDWQRQRYDKLRAETNAEMERLEWARIDREQRRQDALRDLESARERGDSWDEGRALNKLRRLS